MICAERRALVLGVLQSFAGRRYQWGEADCCVLLCRLVEALQGVCPLYYRDWHAMSEERAIALSWRRFGSVGRAHLAGLRALGWHVEGGPPATLEWPEFAEPGDVLVFEGLSSAGYNTAAGGSVVAVVGPDALPWAWSAPGLRPLDVSGLDLDGGARCRRC
ncbi:MAG: hypothetical protein OXQ28_11360 [Acidobacteriota bacterium]|nr:hypothetical protein [Acidobacteriota bacterium]